MEISNLKCFIALAETLSFTKAAQKICISQSAISQQISKLEKTLKTNLINREKKIKLTANGLILLKYAKEILRLEQEAIDYFHQPELEGEVKLGVPEDFATVFLQDILSEFMLAHPRISLNVECDLTLNLMRKYDQNQFDLVIAKTTDNKSESDTQLIFWQEDLVWAASKTFLFNPSNERIPLVLSPDPCVYRKRALESLMNTSLRSKIVYSSPSYVGCNAAVKAGMGITVLPKNMITDDMVILEHESLPKLDSTCIKIMTRSSPAPAVKSLSEFIVKKLEKHD